MPQQIPADRRIDFDDPRSRRLWIEAVREQNRLRAEEAEATTGDDHV
jgi:hypothetical protein